MTTFPPILKQISQSQPYPLLFATISGAHLYGFPSPDSDYDLRGTHILPLRNIVSLTPGPETIETSEQQDTLQLDLVTHDVKKFFTLLLKPNGYVLEQLYSPLVIQTTPEHQELKSIARQCITRHHSHHYLGFAKTQWHLFQQESPPRVKPLLYVYRVLLTGIYLMRTGQVEANLVPLNESFQLPYLPELISQKVTGAEQSTLTESDLNLHAQEYLRLQQLLVESSKQSFLPESPAAKSALSDLLIRIRLEADLYNSATYAG